VQARRRYAASVAIFAVVLFLAIAIAASGIISLYTNREVLTERDTGPLIAPVMFAVATAALYTMLVTLGSQRGSAIVGALLSGFTTYFFFVLSGAVLYSLGKGQPLLGLLFFGSNALGLFALAVALDALAVALSFFLLLAWRDSAGPGRTPRWWWENRDERERHEGD
jgi:hypothetical protein